MNVGLVIKCKYRVINKSLRDFRPLRYSSRDGHAEGEHVNRGTDTLCFCPTLQVLDVATLDAADVNSVIKFLPRMLHVCGGTYKPLSDSSPISSIHNFHSAIPAAVTSIIVTVFSHNLHILTFTGPFIVIYRVIHKSLRDFRTRLRNNQERQGRKEHINR